MANFIGKVRMPGEYVFQNKKADGLTTIADPGPQVYEGDIYIPDLSTVDLSQFQKVYTYADTSQERPYYVFQYVRENLGAGVPAQKVNFAPGTKITFFYNDRLNNTIGTGNVASAAGFQSNDNAIDLDMYSYGYPLSGTGSSSSVIDAMYDFSCSSQSGAGGGIRCDLLAKTAIDADIQGFNASYSQDLDAFLIPGTKRTVNNFSNKGYYFYDSNNNVSMYNEDGIQSYSRSVLLGDTRKYFRRLFKNNSSLRIINDSNAQYVLRMPYLKKDFFSYLYYSIDQTYNGYGTYGLLRDSNTGEYWIMCVGADAFGGTNNFVVLTQFRNCYIGTGSASNVNGTINQVMRYVDESTFGNLDDFLTDLFSVQKEPSYSDDGAPSISGPGDPYGEIDNVDGIVGGRPNIVDELEIDNATPNTAIDAYRQTSGYFGTFKLNNQNLTQYTGTLQQLYEHASDLFFGFVSSGQADKITNNTNNILMLPYEIPSSQLQDAVFAMGNVGIMNDINDWSSYIVGNNYATTKLVKNEIFTQEVSIGTIPHYYDNFLDFAPYSSASLYIPYIGVVELPLNLIQSTSSETKNISLSFRINNTNGDMIVLLKVNGMTICHYSGNCAKPIQISVDDDSGIIKEGISKAISALTYIGTGFSTNGTKWQASPTHPGMEEKMPSGSGSPFPSVYSSNSNPSCVSNTSNYSTSGTTGFMDSQDVILIVERPIIWRPYDYGDLIGYPTKKIAKLKSINGYAKVKSMHLKCSATNEEKRMIEEMLSEGVIF